MTIIKTNIQWFMTLVRGAYYFVCRRIDKNENKRCITKMVFNGPMTELIKFKKSNKCSMLTLLSSIL